MKHYRQLWQSEASSLEKQIAIMSEGFEKNPRVLNLHCPLTVVE